MLSVFASRCKWRYGGMVVMKSYKNAATELDLSLGTLMVQRPLEMNRLYINSLSGN